MKPEGKLFYFFVLSFAGGILAASIGDFGFSAAVFLIFLGLVLALVWRFEFFSDESRRPPRRAAALLSLIIFSAGLGVLRAAVADYFFEKNGLGQFSGKTITLTGVVSAEPDVRENTVRLIVDVKKVFPAGFSSLKELKSEVLPPGATSVSGRILATVPLYPKWNYGDRLALTGKLSKPENFLSDDTGREFDYVHYLAKEGVSFVAYQPKAVFIASNEGNSVKNALYGLKSRLVENIGASIPEPAASLLGGLLFGAKRSLGSELLDEFRKAGIIHIVVLSGYNITIVADSISKFFSFLPKIGGSFFGAAGIILFAIMTGGSATIVRASVMALIVILARSVGRSYNITRALAVAGLIMVIHNPKILAFDPSFQLSFAATLALIYVSPLIQKKLGFITEKFQIREIVSATLSTQIFVLPLILYLMGEISVIALPVNLLILPLVPMTMFFGFLTSLANFLGSVVAAPFAFVTYLFLKFILSVSALAASLPFATISVPAFGVGAMIISFVIYGLILFQIYQKKKLKIDDHTESGVV